MRGLIFTLLLLCWSCAVMAQGQRPSTFPEKTTASPSDAIYTQEDGTNKKLLLSTARRYFGARITTSATAPAPTGNAEGLRNRLILVTPDSVTYFVDWNGDAVLLGGGAAEVELREGPPDTLCVGANCVVLPEVPASLPPSGPAGGSLTGTYPNPGLSVNVVEWNILSAAARDSILARLTGLGTVGTYPVWTGARRLENGRLANITGGVQVIGSNVLQFGSWAINPVGVAGGVGYRSDLGSLVFYDGITSTWKTIPKGSGAANLMAYWTSVSEVASANLIATNGSKLAIGLSSVKNPVVDIVVGEGTGAVNEPSNLRLRSSAVDGNTFVLNIGVSRTANGGANQGYSFLQGGLWGGSYDNPLFLQPLGGKIGLGVPNAALWNVTAATELAIKAPSGCGNCYAGRLLFPNVSGSGVAAGIWARYDKTFWHQGTGLEFRTQSGSDLSGGTTQGIARGYINSDGGIWFGKDLLPSYRYIDAISFRSATSSSTVLQVQSGRDSLTGGTAGINFLPTGLWASTISFGTLLSRNMNVYSNNLGRNLMYFGSSSFVSGSPRTIIVGHIDDPTQWNGNAGFVVYDTISTGKSLALVKKIFSNSVPISVFAVGAIDRFTHHDNGRFQAHAYGVGGMRASVLGKTESIYSVRPATDGTYVEKAEQNNVASGTTDASGDIIIIFSAAMPDATYSALVTLESAVPWIVQAHSKTTASFKVRFYQSTTGLEVNAGNSVTVSYQVTDY